MPPVAEAVAVVDEKTERDRCATDQPDTYLSNGYFPFFIVVYTSNINNNNKYTDRERMMAGMGAVLKIVMKQHRLNYE